MKKKISIAEYIAGSQIKIKVKLSDKKKSELKFLCFEINGLLANIPSLKNAKIPGHNFINPDVKNKLAAITSCYLKAAKSVEYKFPAGQKVFISAIITNKSRADHDNILSSIKDLLEPMVKNKKNRQFGLGVVQNDKLANGFILKWKDKGELSEPQGSSTLIVIQQEDSFLSSAINDFSNRTTNLNLI